MLLRTPSQNLTTMLLLLLLLPSRPTTHNSNDQQTTKQIKAAHCTALMYHNPTLHRTVTRRRTAPHTGTALYRTPVPHCNALNCCTVTHLCDGVREVGRVEHEDTILLGDLMTKQTNRSAVAVATAASRRSRSNSRSSSHSSSHSSSRSRSCRPGRRRVGRRTCITHTITPSPSDEQEHRNHCHRYDGTFTRGHGRAGHHHKGREKRRGAEELRGEIDTTTTAAAVSAEQASTLLLLEASGGREATN